MTYDPLNPRNPSEALAALGELRCRVALSPFHPSTETDEWLHTISSCIGALGLAGAPRWVKRDRGPERSGRFWTEKDEALLEELLTQEPLEPHRVLEMAGKLGRTTGSVLSRLQRLGHLTKDEAIFISRKLREPAEPAPSDVEG